MVLMETGSLLVGSFRRRGAQRQGVQLAAHPGAEGLVDDLVLLQARLAAERFRGDVRPVVVAVAREILDPDLGVGQAVLDQALDLGWAHRHRAAAPSQTSAPAAM